MFWRWRRWQWWVVLYRNLPGQSHEWGALVDLEPVVSFQNSRAAVQMQGEAPPDCCHRRCEAFMPCMFAQSIIIAALAQHHAIAKSALGCKRS